MKAITHQQSNFWKIILTVWGDSSAIRDFIYSEDVAKGMLKVVEKNYNKPVNLGSGKGFHKKDYQTL